MLQRRFPKPYIPWDLPWATCSSNHSSKRHSHISTRGRKWGGQQILGGVELRPDWTAAVSRFQLTCRLAFRSCLCSILVFQLPILHIVNAGHNFKQKGAHQVLWKKVTFLYTQNKRESDGIPSPQKPPSFKTRPSVSNHKIWQPVLLSKVFRFLLQLIKLPFELHQ